MNSTIKLYISKILLSNYGKNMQKCLSEKFKAYDD